MTRSWAIPAFEQPLLAAAVWSLFSVPMRLAIWCHVGLVNVPYRTFMLAILLRALLAAGIALTFIVRALSNTLLPWGMRLWWATELLLFSPVIVPVYCAFHLRRS